MFPLVWSACSGSQVIWVDLLTKAEFEAGFGSHTPMFSGQTKCVRYYMNFERALRLMKEVIAQEGHTFDANNKPGTWLLAVTAVLSTFHAEDAARGLALNAAWYRRMKPTCYNFAACMTIHH